MKRILFTQVLPLLLLSMGMLVIIPESCTKKTNGITGDTGPEGPAGQSGQTKASAVFGYVDAVDQYGNQDSSFANFTVSTHKGDTLVSCLSDSVGEFSLPSLTPGSYDLLFSKKGYDSLKVHVVHSGGNEDKFIGVTRINASVTTRITGQSVSLLPNPFPPDTVRTFQLTLSFDGPPLTTDKNRDFDIYFSRSPLVSSGNNDAMTTTFGSSHWPGTNSYNFQYTLENLLNLGYKTKDTIYVKTYVMPVGKEWTTWFDYSTYTTIVYPYPGDSAVTYFIWP